MPRSKAKKTPQAHESTRITLDPLSPQDALADLLKVKPPPEKKKRGGSQKKPAMDTERPEKKKRAKGGAGGGR